MEAVWRILAEARWGRRLMASMIADSRPGVFAELNLHRLTLELGLGTVQAL